MNSFEWGVFWNSPNLHILVFGKKIFYQVALWHTTLEILFSRNFCDFFRKSNLDIVLTIFRITLFEKFNPKIKELRNNIPLKVITRVLQVRYE